MQYKNQVVIKGPDSFWSPPPGSALVIGRDTHEFNSGK